jgi:hypothetical protein
MVKHLNRFVFLLGVAFIVLVVYYIVKKYTKNASDTSTVSPFNSSTPEPTTSQSEVEKPPASSGDSGETASKPPQNTDSSTPKKSMTTEQIVTFTIIGVTGVFFVIVVFVIIKSYIMVGLYWDLSKAANDFEKNTIDYIDHHITDERVDLLKQKILEDYKTLGEGTKEAINGLTNAYELKSVAKILYDEDDDLDAPTIEDYLKHKKTNIDNRWNPDGLWYDSLFEINLFRSILFLKKDTEIKDTYETYMKRLKKKSEETGYKKYVKTKIEEIKTRVDEFVKKQMDDEEKKKEHEGIHKLIKEMRNGIPYVSPGEFALVEGIELYGYRSIED